MEILKPAVAGTLESSDCMVTVEPGQGKVNLDLDSSVMRQFGPQIKKVIAETLARLDVTDVNIRVVDKGALDCTIKARVEAAVYRSNDIRKDIPWGGAIK
ncbi:MAG: citrate lyase acyl carrier protein [Lachnospiraceae bacterium]|nr:citrate lyase acyl carrier protein [Lachnospiraceae bacterium]